MRQSRIETCGIDPQNKGCSGPVDVQIMAKHFGKLFQPSIEFIQTTIPFHIQQKMYLISLFLILGLCSKTQ